MLKNTKNKLIISPLITAKENISLASFSCLCAFNIEYFVAAPIPSISPLPCIKLNAGIAILSAVSPNVPTPLAIKKVSAKIYTDIAIIPNILLTLYLVNFFNILSFMHFYIDSKKTKFSNCILIF